MSYTDDQAMATEMIAEAGTTMTLTRETAGVYVPATGGFTTTSTTYTVKGVKLNYKSKDIDGTLVKAGDMKVLMAAGVVEPQTTDLLTIGGVVWAIIFTQALEPAETPILYTLQVRK